MKSKTTVVLILALIACIVYAAVRRDGRLTPTPDGPAPEIEGPLLTEKPGTPVAITITDQAGKTLKFQSDAKGWRIIEPLKTGAIDENVAALFNTLAATTCLQRYAPGDPKTPDTSVTGLDKPRWKVTLTDDKQKSFELNIGQYVPLSGKTRTYVRLGDDKQICVAKGDLAETLSRPMGFYRDRRMLTIGADAITSIRIAGAETYRLYRDANDKWIVGSGQDAKKDYPADLTEIKTFLAGFAKIDAQQFVDDAPSDFATYGLTAGSELLSITLAYINQDSGKPVSRTISLGLKTGSGGQNEVYAKLSTSPTVFTLPAELAEKFQPGILKLRDKKILQITEETTSRIELAIDSKSITLAKTGDQWDIIFSPTKSSPANQQRIQLLLNRLAGLKAMGFRSENASAAEFGFEKPRGVIRLFQGERARPVTLTIGSDSPAEAVAFVKSSADNAIASIGASEVDVFLAPVVRYYNPTLWRLTDSGAVTRIAIKRPAGSVGLTKTKDDTWRLEKPIDAPVDTENVNSILDRLDNLTATKIVSVGTKTREYYARGAHPISTTFSTAGDPKTRTFTLSILDGKVYGWMTDDPLARVGLFTGSLYTQLAAEVRRRAVLDFDPASITQISLTSGALPLVLTKVADRWNYPQDPDLRIDQTAAAKYLEQIRNLRAIRFVSSDETSHKKFGLEKTDAWLTLELTTKDKKTITLLISRTGSEETANRYASVSGLPGAFTLSAEATVSLVKKLAEFK
ncbi:MAG: DUF4340 domain-containing protein [Phycisphaerales bacterium]|jgi:hypothetical protein|nr:DUF4340 domain-containing protein [Phycisphaerales bacterium]